MNKAKQAVGIKKGAPTVAAVPAAHRVRACNEVTHATRTHTTRDSHAIRDDTPLHNHDSAVITHIYHIHIHSYTDRQKKHNLHHSSRGHACRADM